MPCGADILYVREDVDSVITLASIIVVTGKRSLRLVT